MPGILTEAEEQELFTIFRRYDNNDNGMLEFDELQKFFTSLNVIVLKEDLQAFFNKVDIDGDGTIDFDEMMKYFESIISESYTSDEIIEAFNLIDKDGSGEVTHEEVASAMEKADVGIPNDEIVMLLKEADVNNNGTICFSEFRSILSAQ